MSQANHTPATSLVIGLTGGIGSGKSTVAKLFLGHGVGVVDADVVAREVVTPGRPGLAEVVAVAGAEVLDTDSSLNRQELRRRIFEDASLREKVEGILHPRIRAEMIRQLSTQTSVYAVLCIPLLLETEDTGLVDRVLVVDVTVEAQIARTRARDEVPRSQVERIIEAQIHRGARLARADDVIDNNGSMRELEAQVDHLHYQYLKLATQ